ncbi:MAG: VWA domain-containing protein [Acidobacteria bacterium]|nr:VWA domain-containing protein [Acidobacteriota bacterium]
MFIPSHFFKARPMRLPRRSLVGLLVALAVSLQPGLAQSQKDKDAQKKQDDAIRVETRLVTMDVIVKDKKGKYITDLKTEDFTVFENGNVQKVDFFEPPLGGGSETPQPRPTDPVTPATSAGAVFGGGRSNLISLVIDGATTDLSNFKQVKEGSLKYIRERITDTDTVAVFGIANDLQLLQSFTQDKAKLIASLEKGAMMPASNKSLERGQLTEGIEQMRAELNSLGGVDPSASPSGAAAGAAAAAQGSAAGRALIVNRILQQFNLLRSQLSIQQARPVLAALAAICSAQQGLPGKKTVILFSQGFITSSTLDWQVQSVIDIANRANIAIYIMDSAGLRTSAPQSTSPVPTAPLAGVSGLASTESRIQAVGGENVFDNVRHEGLNREFDILYRIAGDTGGEFIKGTNDLAKGLSFRFRGGNYVIPISIEVPPGAMKFDRKGDKQIVQFDVLGLIREKPGKVISRLGGSFNIGLTNEQYQSVLQNNIFVRQDMELAPGSYDIELIFRDRATGKVAAKREKLVLPAMDAEFSTSGVVLSRHVEPIKKVPGAPEPVDVFSQAGVQIRPSPSHEFRAEDSMIVFFEVYNAEVNKETGNPMVWVSVRLMKDGQAVSKPIDYVLTESNSLPAPHLTFARFIKLTGLPAGRYTAIIETRDMMTKKLIKLQSPFVVTQ